MNRNAFLVALSASAPLALAAAATAQCNIYRLGFPDFDQKRSPAFGVLGLPGNGGAHCVPTSAANRLAYLERYSNVNGVFDNIDNWDVPAGYNSVTVRIEVLGLMMGTTPEDGTGGSGWHNGLTAWLASRTDGGFFVTTGGASGTYAPSPLEFRDMIEFGGLVDIAYGRYKAEYAAGEGFACALYRDGGHVVTLRHVYNACGVYPELGLRNPADDATNSTQSVFFTQASGSMALSAKWRAGGDVCSGTERTMWVIQPELNDGKFRAIDGYSQVASTYAITPDPIHGVWPSVAKQIRPVGLTNAPRPTHSAPVPNNAPIAGMDIDARATHAWISTMPMPGIPAKLWLHNQVNDTFHQVMDFATPTPGPIVCGVFEVFAANGSNLVRFVGNLSAPTPGGGCPLPLPSLDLAFDDSTKHCLSLGNDGRSHRIHRFFGDVNGDTIVDKGSNTIPASIAIIGTPTIACDASGNILLACTGSPIIYRFAAPVASPTGGMFSGDLVLLGTIVLPAGTQPRSPQFTDTGAVIFVDSGVVREYAPNATGGWAPKTNSLFAGQTAGAFIRVARSRTNMTPGQFGRPQGWFDVPESIGRPYSDCLADVAGDATDTTYSPNFSIGAEDLDAFIGGFIAGNVAIADVASDSLDLIRNPNGTVGSEDLDAFIASFIAGC